MADAVIVVPGIQGTTLVETYGPAHDTIWSALQKGFETIESLALDPTGSYDLGVRNMIEPGAVEALAYGECVGYLRAKLGVPVFLFRYDWRRSCAVNAEHLRGFVGLVTQKCKAKTLSIVTHSMGGLITLAMLRKYPALLDTLEHAVLTVPPLAGSPMAVSALVIGESNPLYLNSNTKFRRVARTCPSVHELVPFYDGAFVRDGAAAADVCWDASKWQRRVDFGGDAGAAAEEKSKADLLEKHLLAARDFHANRLLNLDDAGLSDAHRSKFTILAGTGVPTANSVTVIGKNAAGKVANFFDFEGFRRGKIVGSGDGTVPIESALRFKKVRVVEVPSKIHSAWWDPFTFDDAAKLNLAGYHAAFLSLDKNLSVIREILMGRQVDVGYLPGIER